jgi:hypothetical protein
MIKISTATSIGDSFDTWESANGLRIQLERSQKVMEWCEHDRVICAMKLWKKGLITIGCGVFAFVLSFGGGPCGPSSMTGLACYYARRNARDSGWWCHVLRWNG